MRRSKPFAGHTASVNALASDGTVLLSGSGDHTLNEWSLPSGELLHTYRGHSGAISGVVLLAEDQVASSSYDCTITVYARRGRAIKVLKGHCEAVTSVVLCGGALWSSSWDGCTRRWDLSKLGRSTQVHSTSEPLQCMSAGDTCLVTGSRDGTVSLLDSTAPFACTRLPVPVPRSPVNAIVLAPETVCAGTDGGTVLVWLRSTGELQSSCTVNTHPVFAMCVTPSHAVLSGGGDGALRSWHPSKVEPKELCTSSDVVVFSVAVVAGLMFVGRRDGSILMLKTDKGYRPEGGCVRAQVDLLQPARWEMVEAGVTVVMCVRGVGRSGKHVKFESLEGIRVMLGSTKLVIHQESDGSVKVTHLCKSSGNWRLLVTLGARVLHRGHIAVFPGPIQQLEVLSFTREGAGSQACAAGELCVAARDQFGNPSVQGFERISVHLNDEPVKVSDVPGKQGVVECTIPANVAGDHVLQCRLCGLVQCETKFRVVAGPLAVLTIRGAPDLIEPGQIVLCSVVGSDKYGNPVNLTSRVITVQFDQPDITCQVATAHDGVAHSAKIQFQVAVPHQLQIPITSIKMTVETAQPGIATHWDFQVAGRTPRTPTPDLDWNAILPQAPAPAQPLVSNPAPAPASVPMQKAPRPCGMAASKAFRAGSEEVSFRGFPRKPIQGGGARPLVQLRQIRNLRKDPRGSAALTQPIPPNPNVCAPHSKIAIRPIKVQK